MTIDLTENIKIMKSNANYLKGKGIIFPTFKQMKLSEDSYLQSKHDSTKSNVSEIHPKNLFKINWYNTLSETSQYFHSTPIFIELPRQFTGVDAKIIALVGKFFPTGSHKVGSSYACLIPKIVTGQFNIESNYAVWPSTGNYCRGGAFNSAIIGCKSIAILPENMSLERFDWLRNINGEIITTFGAESNVKEIFDKVKELKASRNDIHVFNQFSDFFNYLWHYEVTGSAMCDIIEKVTFDRKRVVGVCLASGSAGVLGSADYLKKIHPFMKLAVAEAIQCPTLQNNGFGEHRIEGIGDKHVPWIHNVKNTDMVIGIDDADVMSIFNLLNEKNGQDYLQRNLGLDENLIAQLEWAGLSGIANILSCIKYSKYFELSANDIVLTVLTDSSDMYKSKLTSSCQPDSNYTVINAAIDYNKSVLGIKTDYVEELTYTKKKSIHNLKYFTWVEQQGYDVEELDAQWYNDYYWEDIQKTVDDIDKLIIDFNSMIK